MGYPMTFDRVIRRNNLGTGGYDDAAKWGLSVNLNNLGLMASGDEFDRVMVGEYRRRLREYEASAKMLLGDLRRLETDAIDERAVCAIVAERTKVDPETVAVVIREFLRS